MHKVKKKVYVYLVHQRRNLCATWKEGVKQWPFCAHWAGGGRAIADRAPRPPLAGWPCWVAWRSGLRQRQLPSHLLPGSQCCLLVTHIITAAGDSQRQLSFSSVTGLLHFISLLPSWELAPLTASWATGSEVAEHTDAIYLPQDERAIPYNKPVSPSRNVGCSSGSPWLKHILVSCFWEEKGWGEEGSPRFSVPEVNKPKARV